MTQGPAGAVPADAPGVDRGHGGPDQPVVEVEAVTGFARVDDGYQRLWTPHRMVYIEGNKDPEPQASCPFCTALDRGADGLVVARGELCFVVMNLFPYNPGHLLICPYRHVARYLDLTDQETADFTELTKHSLRALEAAYAPMGYNLGMNQGEVAGAGVAAHLHQHIVPRWRGDANFLPIVGQTKTMPLLLEDVRARLAEVWDRT